MDDEGELLGFCEEYFNGKPSERIKERIIASIHADILNLIKAMRVYLTSTDVEQRCLATKLLSEVLDEFSCAKILSGDEVQYLVDFLCDRLKDHTIIIHHVLSGLLALVTGQGVIDKDVILISRTIFKELHCQALRYEDRYKVFSIFHNFLTGHVQVLAQHSEEVVMGYVEVMAGERDPRNLLLAFSSVVLILHNFHFNAMVEELFEVVSCYFPIDFSASPGDGAVSREALVLGLRKCLSATPKFAELCLPLLVEKLSSDVLSAKLDSLQTLVCAVPVCGMRVLSGQLLHLLWNTIKTEMFKSANRDLQDGCVAVVRCIAAAVSPPPRDSQLSAFLQMVLQEISVLNAYILQKSSNTGGKKQDYLNFRQSLAVELVGTSRRSQGGRPRTFEHSQLLRLDNSQSHLPECVTLKRDCIVCSDVRKKKGLLRQEYRHESCIKCSTCHVHLCLSKGRNCYKKYPTEVEYC